MSTEQLIIPKICKAGFNLRSDTYSGKLAYVIYKDNKNVWRKEKSWESWRHKEGEEIGYYDRADNERKKKVHGPEVAPLEFENIPTEGFVLNKKVGGHSSGWNHRSTYARVYDPRGFEFEVSIPNLLFILQETDCSRGKGLLGEFVYAWDGKDLVLLPCGSVDYQKSQEFTKMQDNKISAKDLIPGATYKKKNNELVIYLGRLPYINPSSWKYYSMRDGKRSLAPKPDHVFVHQNGWKKGDFFSSSASILAEVADPNPHPNYAELMERYSNSDHGKKVKLTLESCKSSSYYRELRFKYITLEGKEVLVAGDSYNSNYYGRSSFRPEHVIELSEEEIVIKPLEGRPEISNTNLLKLNINFI